MFATMSSTVEYIRAGKLRALAVCAAIRSEALPDIPPVSDFVAGYEASTWSPAAVLGVRVAEAHGVRAPISNESLRPVGI